jgi:proteasome lid subunit RPN8/RPN11
MRPVTVPAAIVRETLAHLQQAGRQCKECVVLWLAEDRDAELAVKAAYRPDQMAKEDVFRIPPSSMRALLATLSRNGLMIAAQVHSHPQQAFHSRADDTWAIVRHVGALSLVVPDFALKTTAATFRTNTKIFRLDRNNRWGEVPLKESQRCLHFT